MAAAEFKRIRLKLGLTQEDAAAVLGLSGPNAVSNIETGFRNPNRLAMALLRLLDDLSLDEAKQFASKLASQSQPQAQDLISLSSSGSFPRQTGKQ